MRIAFHSMLVGVWAAGAASGQITTLPRRVTAPVVAAAQARNAAAGAAAADAFPPSSQASVAPSSQKSNRGTAVYGHDPFHTLIEPPKPGAKPHARPLGRKGLGVDDLKVEGVAVGGPLGPVALVSSPDDRTYFLHPGDRVFDGVVSRIDANGIWFRRVPPPGESGMSSGGEVFRKVS
ncbi:MAG: hypothetical protein ACYC6M_00380 [Terriglobales bacterium]